MAADDANQTQASKKEGKGVAKIVFVASLVAFGLGAAVGAVSWSKLHPASVSHESDAEPEEEMSFVHDFTGTGEHNLGKIVVPLSGTQLRPDQTAPRLLIDPVVVFQIEPKPSEGEREIASPEQVVVAKTSEFRDAFVAYLSQLSVEETRGSYALMSIRAELTRRARLLAEDVNISNVLIQEFMVQR
mgnify:CR=1 FL=1